MNFTLRLYLRWVRLRAGKIVITGVLLCNRERDKIETRDKEREREIERDSKSAHAMISEISAKAAHGR